MVKTIKEHNIPKNTVVVVTYNSTYEYIVLWDYENKTDTSFYSPHVTICKTSSNYSGSFRLHSGCEFVRLATTEEKVQLQTFLDKKGIDFKIPIETTYELW